VWVGKQVGAIVCAYCLPHNPHKDYEAGMSATTSGPHEDYAAEMCITTSSDGREDSADTWRQSGRQ